MQRWQKAKHFVKIYYLVLLSTQKERYRHQLFWLILFSSIEHKVLEQAIYTLTSSLLDQFPQKILTQTCLYNIGYLMCIFSNTFLKLSCLHVCLASYSPPSHSPCPGTCLCDSPVMFHHYGLKRLLGCHEFLPVLWNLSSMCVTKISAQCSQK